MKKIRVTITFEFPDDLDRADMQESAGIMIRSGILWFHERIRKLLARRKNPQPFDAEDCVELKEELKIYEQATKCMQFDFDE